MKKIILISLLVSVSSCSLLQMQPRPIAVKTIAEIPTIYDPPLPLELQLLDIDWTVFTPDLMAELLSITERLMSLKRWQKANNLLGLDFHIGD